LLWQFGTWEKGFASGGLDPAYMGQGSVPAVKRVLKQTGMALSNIDMIGLNEAFVAQAVGCKGARQMVTAIHQNGKK
jgi:acetyl-CoA acetyltransferase